MGVQGEKHILKCFVSYLVIVGCFGDWDLEKFWGLEVESIWDALKVRSDETTMEVTQSSQEGLPGLSGDASCCLGTHVTRRNQYFPVTRQN